MDDEFDRLKPAGLPADMQRWNIEDLQAYAAAMRAEITHVESIIIEKKGSVSSQCPIWRGVIRPFIVQTFCGLALGFGSTWQWLHPISQRQCGGMAIDH